MTIERLIRKVPKCELHLHIEGTLEPELMFELAERNRIPLKYKTVAKVRKAYKFKNLKSFLDIYYEGASVLRCEEDFYDLTYAYFRKAKEQNIRHAEIFFDPQTHTDRGVPFEVVIRGISEARKDAARDFGVSSFLILCFLRHLPETSALVTLRQALPFRSEIIGVGLDSYEVGNPGRKFKKAFAAARRNGFLPVAHAGEEGPARNIREAIEELKVRRIDHGVRCLEDPKLVQELVRRKIPLTVCPLSNVKLGVFPDMKRHPLKEMLDRGLLVTVNSDDPAYFGGYLNENYLSAQKALGFTRDEVVRLARNSFEASFLPCSKKEAHLKTLRRVTCL
jgi:adenosine deaminase